MGRDCSLVDRIPGAQPVGHPAFPPEAELGIQLARHGGVKVDRAADNEWATGCCATKDCGRGNWPGTNTSVAQLVDEYQETGVVEHHWAVNRNKPRLAHSGDPAGADPRDGAPGIGVQRRAHSESGAEALMMSSSGIHASGGRTVPGRRLTRFT